jgi:hypothetical protein
VTSGNKINNMGSYSKSTLLMNTCCRNSYTINRPDTKTLVTWKYTKRQQKITKTIPNSKKEKRQI